MNFSATQASMASDCIRPMRDLIRYLPLLKTNDQGAIDCEGSEPDVLQSVVYAADAVACAVHAGMGAIGNLVVCAAPNFEDGIVGCDAVEALGWLLSELGDLGASAAAVSAQCRRRDLA